jgi:ribosomal protein S18 acetylase RimI-like enzyme
MNIRQARHTDLDDLVELNRDVQEMHVGFRPSVFKSTSDHDMTPALSEFIDSDCFHTFIAEDNGRAIGYVIAEFRHQKENAFKYSRDYLRIHQIAVAPSHRRKGVATALLNHAQALAEQAGVTRLEIDVYTTNQDAKVFYTAQGFRTFRELMEKEITQQDAAADADKPHR